jgi:hypothetical protein
MTALFVGPTLAFMRHLQHHIHVTSTSNCSPSRLSASALKSSANKLKAKLSACGPAASNVPSSSPQYTSTNSMILEHSFPGWLAPTRLHSAEVPGYSVQASSEVAPRCTSNLLVFLEMGRYPMQIQLWLQRTLSYWNKSVANKAESELLDFVLAAGVWQGRQGLHEDHDHDCWAKELLAGLMFVDPSKD